MRDTFEQALSAVLVHEGGYVNHPRDPGGATNLGVTIGTAKRLGIDVDGDGDTDTIDIKLLKPTDAAKVYRAEYWNKVRGDDLPAGVDYAVFDYAVNSGPGRAAKALQKLVGVPQDGQIGPKTLGAVAAVHPLNLVSLINAYCDDRMAFLRGLKTFPTFGKGWTSRVQGVRALATDMVRLEPIAPPKLQPAPSEPPVAPLPIEPADLPQTPAESTARVLPKALIIIGVIVALAAIAWFVVTQLPVIPS